jgi:hypothetical protein
VAALAFALLAPAGPNGMPAPIPLVDTTTSGPTSTALAGSIRQHAISAGDGPLTDRVAWEAMAQLVTQEKLVPPEQGTPEDPGVE